MRDCKTVFRSSLLRGLLAGAVLCAGAPTVLAAEGPMDFLFTSGAPPMADRAEDVQRVWKIGEFSAIRISPREAGAKPNQYPVAVEASVLQRYLAGMQFEASGGRYRALFDKSELGELAPALASALVAAGPNDDLLVLTSARREAGFISVPQSVSARIFAVGAELNVIIDETRGDAITQHRVSKIVPEITFGSRSQPSRAKLKVSGGNLVRPDWAVFNLAAELRPVVVQPGTAAPTVAPAAPVLQQAPARARDEAFYADQAKRLSGLKALREQNLITEAEYQRKRQEIIDGL